MTRIAIVGDHRTGKTTQLAQWVIRQSKEATSLIFIGSRNAFQELMSEIGQWVDCKTQLYSVPKAYIGTCRISCYEIPARDYDRLRGVYLCNFDGVAIDEFQNFLEFAPRVWLQEYSTLQNCAVIAHADNDKSIDGLLEILKCDVIQRTTIMGSCEYTDGKKQT